MPNRKILLDEDEVPKQWYNILPDLPKPLPPIIDPTTREPGPGIVPKIFPKAILGQEFSPDRWINIPEEVREIYRLWRPTPMYRAVGLEKHLKPPQRSTTSTREQAPQEATRPTQPSHKSTTT